MKRRSENHNPCEQLSPAASVVSLLLLLLVEDDDDSISGVDDDEDDDSIVGSSVVVGEIGNAGVAAQFFSSDPSLQSLT